MGGRGLAALMAIRVEMHATGNCVEMVDGRGEGNEGKRQSRAC